MHCDQCDVLYKYLHVRMHVAYMSGLIHSIASMNIQVMYLPDCEPMQRQFVRLRGWASHVSNDLFRRQLVAVQKLHACSLA